MRTDKDRNRECREYIAETLKEAYMLPNKLLISGIMAIRMGIRVAKNRKRRRDGTSRTG